MEGVLQQHSGWRTMLQMSNTEKESTQGDYMLEIFLSE